MKIPLSWLREYAPFEVEADRLAVDLTAAGLAVDAIERAGDEIVLELDITTNRVDCMNVYGVAREVAALYGLPLRALDAASDRVSVEEVGKTTQGRPFVIVTVDAITCPAAL